ncbi:MAG: cytochrome c-type biogenesis protein CcmH [bacterium]
MTRSVLLLTLGVWLAAGAAPAAGLSGEALESRVREISDGLRCPTCQSISVNDSEAAFSRQIRDKVRRMLVEGQGEDDIYAFFVSRYGEWILRAPKKEGLGLVLWILPGLGMLLFGVWIGRKAYQSAQASRRTAAELGDSPLSDSQRALIDGDLRRFEEGD